MIYESKQMEREALIATARRMCAAARTAPKTKGVDNLLALVLTDGDKDALADKMDEFAGDREGVQFFHRDANNLREAGAVVLIGAKNARAGLFDCWMCGYSDCAKSKAAGAKCFFPSADLGIAVGSAVSIAARECVDNRVMFSAGRVAREMNYVEDDVTWLAIPLSISGKSPFFDRKPKK